MAQTLQKLRDLEPNVVMSSGFVVDVSHGEVTQSEWLEVMGHYINQHQKHPQ